MIQGTIEGHVNASCVVMMSSACSDQQKKDVMDCMLYTQLAATKKHPRFAAAPEWKSTWLAAFNRFGWSVGSHDSQSLPASELGQGTVCDWLGKRLPVFIPKDVYSEGIAVVTRSVSGNPDQPAVAMLDNQIVRASSSEEQETGVAERRIDMQFAFCGANSALGLALLSFTTRQSSSAALLTEVFNPDAVQGNVEMAFHSAHMNEMVYAQYREKIAQALDGRRVDLVCAFQEARDVQRQ